MVLSDDIKDRLNVIKSNPDPLSQAQMLVDLKSTSSVANKDIAHALEMKPSNVSHLLRVTKLPEMVLDGYTAKQISFTHLILISRLKKHEDIVNLYEEILKNGYTALQTERRIREILYLVDNFGNYVNKNKIKSYEERIVKSLGEEAKASIIQTRIKAKITIEITGNLAKTTQFIDSFVTRFRSKRNVESKPLERMIEPELPTIKPGLASGGSSVEYGAPGIDAGDMSESVVENVTILAEDEKKYRFDPDF